VLAQIERGSDALDINIGPGRSDGPDAMRWLVRCVQDVTDATLCIDTPGLKTMLAALEVCENPTIINSTTAEQQKMSSLFPLAAEHGAEIICLTMDERGVPNDAESRAEMAMLMMTTAMEHGITSDRIYLDPLVLPVSAAQDQGWKVIEAIRMFRMLDDPAPKTVVGLSNISNGASGRSLINQTYFAMLAGAGLSAAIMDPEDIELMSVLKTTDILLNRRLYCNDYLRV
jgi:5-methyltetrahydrofolate corrinoid/iron sulfur protein methyltransferase